MTTMTDDQARALLSGLADQALSGDREHAADRLIDLVEQLPAEIRQAVEHAMVHDAVDDRIREYFAREVAAGRAVEVEPGVYQSAT